MCSCPSPQQLQQLLEEQLNATELGAVAGHVNECTACQAALEQLTGAAAVSGVALSLAHRSGGGNAAAATDTLTPFLTRMKETSILAGLAPSLRGTTREPPTIGKMTPNSSLPVVPGYAIIRELGRGGMGVVYQAQQVGLNRMVALKMILAGAHAGPKHLARFCKEAEAIASLHHPNIVQIYEIGEADGIPYCALEYIEEGNLGQRLHGDPQALEPVVSLIETRWPAPFTSRISMASSTATSSRPTCSCHSASRRRWPAKHSFMISFRT